MRLGFVGVGRWAQKLATAFRACGAEIVCHVRSRECACNGMGSCPHCHAPGFGTKMKGGWRALLERPDLDAIIAVAPPEVTTEVALACAAAGKPVMATKPLFDHPASIRAPFYVDFWRLWSEAQREPETNHFSLYGPGPVRDFPGGFDYGPHVMAAMLDRPGFRLVHGFMWEHNTGEMIDVVFESANGGQFYGEFGNGAKDAVRNVWGHDETPLAIGTEPKDQILQRFCQSFLNDVSEGFVDTRLLNLSRDGMRELRKIREMACRT